MLDSRCCFRNFVALFYKWPIYYVYINILIKYRENYMQCNSERRHLTYATENARGVLIKFVVNYITTTKSFMR